MADPDLHEDVNCLILDYLVCLAIEQTLSAADDIRDPVKAEEADWLVQSLKAFGSLPETPSSTSNSPSSLAVDLNIKREILWVADAVRCYKQEPRQGREPDSPQLATIGLQFMNLCLAAVPKVSESRWLDVGAQFLHQAAVHDHHAQDPGAIKRLQEWVCINPRRNKRWFETWQAYGCNEGVAESSRRFPLTRFKDTVMRFLLDLMTVLEPPILIELERGKLGNLSRDETRALLERAQR
ncbi:hypothetical protein N7533_000497 [Penicillium manginii]|uniref:uncharacterized protein n=1 Tax=Penicillium manginii TaxID=203109 RepID=UPI002546FA00|nr:uncharacterized protein N7533_000497 [Penicillium manginii]KAJ5767914.1 hypothetical protein N7533_000497 [Penicillium manginii]